MHCGVVGTLQCCTVQCSVVQCGSVWCTTVWFGAVITVRGALMTFLSTQNFYSRQDFTDTSVGRLLFFSFQRTSTKII